jgi:hypothetical protein
MNIFTGALQVEVDRKSILMSFLDNIHRISDKAYNKRVWIDGAGPECHDFDEAVNDFFWDGPLILESHKDFGITDSQYKILAKFRDEFRKFSDDNDFPEEFIDTPEWAKIMELAKDVLRAFNYSKTES